MKVGYPNHPRRDLLEEIAWIGNNGFEFIDLFLEPDVCDHSRIRPQEVKAAIRNFRLDTVGHLAWYLPIGSPMKELRDGAIEGARKYLEVFSALECPKVTIHAHWPPSMFSAEEGIAFQVDSLRRLVQLAQPLGLKMIYEPVGAYQESRENLKPIFAQVPELGFHLDVGHFNLHHRDPGEFAVNFRDRLEHVHCHDNDGHSDLHLPIGAGKMDWKKVIPKLKSVYDGTVTIEVFSNDRDYVLLARKKFLELWANS